MIRIFPGTFQLSLTLLYVYCKCIECTDDIGYFCMPICDLDVEHDIFCYDSFSCNLREM